MKRPGHWGVALALLMLEPATALAADPPPLDAYGDLPALEDAGISPSGKGLAMVASVNGKRNLLALDADGKLRKAIPLEDMKIDSIQWVGEDTLLMVNRKTQDLGMEYTADKTELSGAVIIPLGEGEIERVFDHNSSIADAIAGSHGLRQIGGRWMGYFGGYIYDTNAYGRSELMNGKPALFAVDMARNSVRQIAHRAADGHYRDWLVDGAGAVGATLDVTSATGKWQLLNGDDKIIAAGTDPEGDIDLVCFGPDGTSVIYGEEDNADGAYKWHQVPLAGGPVTEAYPDVDMRRSYIDHTNSRLLGYLEEGAPPKPVLFNPTNQQAVSKIYRAFSRLNVELIEWTPDFSHLLVRTSGNEDSGTWFRVDMKQMKADAVGYERPAIAPEQVGPIATVAYKASDGLEMDGILTLPPGKEAKNLPVILLPHGGPEAHDEAAFDWWEQAFASRGYAVFQPNFRGSTNRDGAFRRAGYGQWGRKMQSDISDGLAELAKQGIVDPKRACIVGASYGGYAALAGVTLQNGLYRCAVAVAGVSDLELMYRDDFRESGENRMVKRSLLESLGDRAGFAAVSPRRFAARADAPILLIHGKDDTVVPFHQSEVMVDALRAAGKPYELVVLKAEDHWLSSADTRKQMLEATMGFVQKYNPAQ